MPVHVKELGLKDRGARASACFCPPTLQSGTPGCATPALSWLDVSCMARRELGACRRPLFRSSIYGGVASTAVRHVWPHLGWKESIHPVWRSAKWARSVPWHTRSHLVRGMPNPVLPALVRHLPDQVRAGMRTWEHAEYQLPPANSTLVS